MIKNLRQWRANHEELFEEDCTVRYEIASNLEYYIYECYSYLPKLTGDWFTDGIKELEIHHSSNKPNCFKLLGSVWMLGNESGSIIEPFEIDITLNPLNDQYFAKTKFRFGFKGSNRPSKLTKYNFYVAGAMDNRPRRSCDWRIAIELSPPDPSGHELE
ncbi:hypothetical protein Pan54_28270 [Rubinisphaera italica]|uniref:Uncharacterized protein n=1 Tax=Rubinisphaera italica TaxID=2527969 RepID=A0A5C5XHC7_9PLAN|nr:hypothetical protein Pan54_28270 [Rubinisphaera italica]